MRLTHISITNMAGFEEFATNIPIVAIIQGKNGLGKSSLLDCLKYAFGRGHDEDMIHGDAPEGEILIEFDDGSAVKCRAVRERHETVRGWRAANSKRFIVSREQIDRISNAISYDALAFMDKDEKEQLQILLRIMPIECSDEEIAAAVGGAIPFPPPFPGNALDRINALHKHMYNVRRDFNVGADAQEKHAGELEKTLPPAPPEGADWNAEVTRIQRQKEQLERDRDERLAKVQQILDEEKSAASAAYDNALRAAAEAYDKALKDARTQTDNAAAAIKEALAPKLEAFHVELGRAQERARATAEAEGTRKAILAARDSAAAQLADSEKLTGALTRLEKLKELVASRFTIKGITIQDGRILKTENGKPVPFKRWNTEAKIRFCLRIAVLAHGEAGFICIDNAEHLDQDKRIALVQTAEKYAERDGLQFIIASVSGTPLQVTEARAM